jgi:transposase
MPKGSVLSEFERGRIIELSRQAESNHAIARAVNRSVTVVRNFLRIPAEYATKHAGGKPSILSGTEKRAVLRAASNKPTSLSKLRGEISTKVSRSTIHRVLQSSGTLRFVKMQAKPRLELVHKQGRIQWAKLMVRNATQWESVVVSDEKRFCLDGPDGYSGYWHDLRKETLIKMSRQQGGGGVMVWAATGYNGVVWTFVEETMNSARYAEVLESYLLPYGHDLGGPNWIFQQDGAKVHTSHFMMDWFRTHNVRVLDWPSRSPDQNLQENVWGIIVRDVYNNNKQYNTVTELKTAIERAFNRIDMLQVQRLFYSMPDRLCELLLNNGGKTHY